MYISPFIAGVAATICAKIALIILLAIVKAVFSKQDKESVE